MLTSQRPTLECCPLCDDHELNYQFTHATTAIVGCGSCGLLMRNPQPSDDELGSIYGDAYFLGLDRAEPAGDRETDRLKRETAAGYLEEIEARLGSDGGHRRRLLEIGPGLGNLLVEAQSRGYDVTGVEYSEASVRAANRRLGAERVLQGSLGTVPLPEQSFDVAVLADTVEHTRDPLADLEQVWRLLRPGGVLFIAVPSLDSWSARMMRERWLEFKLEHLFYFDSATIQLLLFRSGFEQVTLSTGKKTVSPDYVISHFDRFPVPVLSPMARAGGVMLPAWIRRRRLRMAASGINVMAARSSSLPPVRRRQRLSVIMPVFNERATFPIVVRQLLNKSIAGIDLDLVIVESNSTDGTRDEVRKIDGHPRVTVLYEDRPRGKGHAVRKGLASATGDYVLIQDADLEYDLNDYETLLEPLVRGRAAFVLGSRHADAGPTWKIRNFANQLMVSSVMNFGHVLFTGLFNVVYGTRLRDPFTMYKVFRRDCLHGLTFEANRFDFDWELVGKLVRAGYRPLEIPVNYRSRSFAEGKKVRFLRDPLTWIRACFKYRVVPLGKRAR